MDGVALTGPSWDDFEVDFLLGEGAYGKVFKVYRKDENIIRQSLSRLSPTKKESEDYFSTIDKRLNMIRSNTTKGSKV
jgi:uncharacterized protein (UPF0262 family)